jgi:hypothetical protein
LKILKKRPWLSSKPGRREVSRDQDADRRAAILFDQIKTELLTLLRTAPDFGSVGIDIYLTQGKVVRLSVKAEITKKLEQRNGGGL